SDQQPKWNSIHHFVPFLNHDTAVFIGAQHIARTVDAFMMYGRMSRPKRGYYHLDIIPMEDHPATMPENTLTNRYFQLLEEDIKAHPEMWLWTHKRWSRTKEEWLRRQEQKQ
ncbi:MAG: acetyltransferase, partial [Bacteroidaceae bacterium]|nr:acetyltransferase [Bacteroidaceae bacterium]